MFPAKENEVIVLPLDSLTHSCRSAIFTNKPPITGIMSSHPQIPTSSSQFKLILDAALSEYKKQTGNDLSDNWIAKELQTCDTVEAVLDIIQHQAEVFDKFRGADKKLMKWIGSSVHVLYTISATLGEGVGMVHIGKTIRDDLRCILTPFCRRFLLRKQSLLELVSSSPFVHLCSFLSTILMLIFYRQQGMSG